MNDHNNQNMPVTFKVTNEMLYEMIKEFRNDVDRRFDAVERRIDQVEYRMDRLEQRLEKVETKVAEVHESRKLITVRFTNGWAFASFFMAVVSAGMVMVFGRAL